MAYDLYLVETPVGADVEETAEALLVRLAGGVRRPIRDSDRERMRSLEERLRFVHRPFVASDGPVPETRELRADDGVEVLLDAEFVRVRLPFRYAGEEAEAVFERVFGWLELLVEETGWSIYDPQDAQPVLVGDRDRDRILEIYLSVMDQI